MSRLFSTKATNIKWHHGISQAERFSTLNTMGATLWFTGLSGSGKSTVAVALETCLLKNNVYSYRLDGDNIRHGLNKNLGFGAEDRTENIRRVGEVAKLFSDAGLITLCAFISPYKRDRDAVRKMHEEGKLPFIEIFVDSPLSICENRDPKGLYKQARLGKLKQFTGIDDPYEEPVNPEIRLRTDKFTTEECAQQIVEYLRHHKIIKKDVDLSLLK
eukprot:TRINITY_DN80230_c0_g1_i1.p1 TRINITY_DN80230_c0_g1~~TRINITY_DN80230_c0_g1_i1.p1  ORF type:complete len:225 (+),score=31.17 TRINITY_DN80230_c0_g1_i1:30-677(+)